MGESRRVKRHYENERHHQVSMLDADQNLKGPEG